MRTYCMYQFIALPSKVAANYSSFTTSSNGLKPLALHLVSNYLTWLSGSWPFFPLNLIDQRVLHPSGRSIMWLCLLSSLWLWWQGDWKLSPLCAAAYRLAATCVPIVVWMKTWTGVVIFELPSSFVASWFSELCIEYVNPSLSPRSCYLIFLPAPLLLFEKQHRES